MRVAVNPVHCNFEGVHLNICEMQIVAKTLSFCNAKNIESRKVPGRSRKQIRKSARNLFSSSGFVRSHRGALLLVLGDLWEIVLEVPRCWIPWSHKPPNHPRQSKELLSPSVGISGSQMEAFLEARKEKT